jgi:hypothetical protein
VSDDGKDRAGCIAPSIPAKSPLTGKAFHGITQHAGSPRSRRTAVSKLQALEPLHIPYRHLFKAHLNSGALCDIRTARQTGTPNGNDH